MSRRRSRKRRKPTKPSSRSRGPVFFRAPEIGAGLTPETRSAAFREVGIAYAKERDSLLPDVINVLGRHDPLRVLSILATYGLMTSPGASPRSPSEPERISQSHVELAQALALHAQRPGSQWEATTPDVIQRLWDQLIALSKAFDLAALGERSEENSGDVFLVQQRVRMSTRGVRNWGYYSQVTSIADTLLKPLDNDFDARFGFRASLLVRVADHMIRAVESRLTQHHRDLMTVFREKTVAARWQVFRTVFAGTPAVEELNAFEAAETLSLEQSKVVAVMLGDLVLPVYFMFAPDRVAQAIEASPESISRLFESLSLSEGALAERDPRLFFLDNPVWCAPVIPLEAGAVFCAVPQTMLSFVFEIVDGWVKPYPELATRWQDRRASGLEALTREVLMQALPGARAWRNVGWTEAGASAQGECDAMVRFDSLLLLVECKSGAVSAPARRGAPARMQREIEALLEHPSWQSQRLLEGLNAQLQGGPRVDLSQPVDLDGVHYILRLSVTLDDFSTIQANLSTLQDAGLLGLKVRPAPTLCLADLMTIAHILGRPALFLHYVHRRMHLQGALAYEGDELDLLGCYLRNGLLFGDGETAGAQLIFVGMSLAVDRYMTARDEQLLLTKPTRALSAWWSAMLRHLEHSRFPRSTEAALALLEVDVPDQRQLEGGLKKLMKRHRRRRHAGLPHDSVLMCIPGGLALTAVAMMVFTNDNRAQRHALAANAMSLAFRDPRPGRCVLVAMNADAPRDPYSFLTLANRGDGAPSQTFSPYGEGASRPTRDQA